MKNLSRFAVMQVLELVTTQIGFIEMYAPRNLQIQCKKKAELRDCKTVEEFEAVALKHGYKKGWGYYQWQLRNKKR